MNSSFLQSFLQLASARRDLVVVVFMITGIMAMILPISPIMADILIATNLGLSVLLLMVALSLRSPVEFISLPSVILITTVFRLSISIATTRLILTEAEGGAIVETFGNFVISGNVIVGLVVFLIITIVQFVVITKGSERVAEVAARFSLDGLPGKQMSIDSDLRNGDIDQVEARRRRTALEKESQLYGAMDGAMKFVKGDAIAGIIIVAVNLFGGMAVGTVQKGMSFGQAVQVFSLLTIGEGLIAQIPALFVSLTAGTIVTRVASETSQNLGTDIVGQLTARPDALRLAGFVLFGLALIPGFPTGVFMFLGVFFGGTGILLARSQTRKATRVSELQPAVTPLIPVSSTLPSVAQAPVVVAASPDLFNYLIRENADHRLSVSCQMLANDFGFACPSVGYRKDDHYDGYRYTIEIDGIPEVSREIDPELLYVPSVHAARLKSIGVSTTLPTKTGTDFIPLEAAVRSELVEAEIEFYTFISVLESDARDVILRNAPYFLGIQETRRLLSSLESQYKDLLKEVQKVAPIQRIADILRRLLEERISIRNLRLILETILEWAPREQDSVVLLNHVRTALRKQICFQYAVGDRVIKTILIERETEDAIRVAIQTAISRNMSSIDADFNNMFLESLQSLIKSIDEVQAKAAVILTATDLRRVVWTMVAKGKTRLPVFSYQDIAPEFTIEVLGTLRLTQTAAPKPMARAG